MIAPDHVQFIGPRNDVVVKIGQPKTRVLPPYPEATKLFERRGQSGGICPVRSSTRVPRDGSTHKNVQVLMDGVKRRTGVEPLLLKEKYGLVYLDPAAHLVATSVLALAYNG